MSSFSLKLKTSFSNIIKGISNKNCLRLLNSIPRLPALAATYNEGLCQSREVSIQVFLALLFYLERQIFLAFDLIERYRRGIKRFTYSSSSLEYIIFI